jgi:putative membrane protein
MPAAVLNYILHLVTASMLLAAFFKLYTRVTPFDEVLLIRQGNCAALLSLAGALIGFVLTLASAVVHTVDYRQFLGWAFGAMAVQVIVYVIASRALKNAKEHIEDGNIAYGGLMGAISLCVGIVNGACVS